MRDYPKGIDTAFTVASFGIAESATMVLDSTDEDLRLASMLAEHHLLALPKSRIVPDATYLSGYLREAFEASKNFTAFISGPSRTADIERELTLGVHGPLRVTAALLKS
jgi:L-lactate dehydrogenase complex protein LldG